MIQPTALEVPGLRIVAADGPAALALAEAVLAHDRALTEWAKAPNPKAPPDDTYQTMLRLAREIIG